VNSDLKRRLIELTEIPAVSGSEQSMARKMFLALKPLADKTEIDQFGNVTATRHGPKEAPSLMITAHSDEVGGIVTSILPTGFLRFQTLGVVGLKALPAANVLVSGHLRGVVGAPSSHLSDGAENDRAKGEKDLFIDVGARDAAEARAWGIREGSPVTFFNPLHEVGQGGRLCGKAIDNRIGCAILWQLLSDLQGTPLPLTLHIAITVQEEVTMSGAGMVVYHTRPDFALAVDTMPAADTPDNDAADCTSVGLGRGVVFQLAEGVPRAFRGTLVHPAIRDLLIRTAEEEGIPYQLSALYGHWTTDGARIYSARGGIPCGLVSVPRRYSHTASEVLDPADAEAALQVLRAVVLRTGPRVKLSFVDGLEEQSGIATALPTG